MQQFLFIACRRLIPEEGGKAGGKRIEIFFKSFAVLFAQAFGAKIDIDIEIGNGSAHHAAVLAVDRSPVGVQLDELLVQAVAETLPVPALHVLDIERLPSTQRLIATMPMKQR